jgi:hypothetical protein
MPQRSDFLHDRPGKTTLEFSDLPQPAASFSPSSRPVFLFRHSNSGLLTRRVESSGSVSCFRHKRRVQSTLRSCSPNITGKGSGETEANLRLSNQWLNISRTKSGNALVPLSTHRQLLKEAINDPEFQESLSTAMAVGVRRISRLANQMVSLPVNGRRIRRVRHAFRPHRRAFLKRTLIIGKKIAQLAFANCRAHGT